MSRSLCQATTELLLWCQDRQIKLLVRHIPGRLNVLADRLSRISSPLQSEWSLKQVVAEQIFIQLGRPMTDLFATRLNNKLPLFVSPVADSSAWAVDAMSIPWENLFLYAFPPLKLIPQVLLKVQQTPCKLLLVAPLWPQRSWFPLLFSLLTDFPRALPPLPDLLSQAGGRFVYPNVQVMNLHPWALSSVDYERKSFLKRLQTSSRSLLGLQPGQSTMPNGECSPIGVVDGISIPAVPLFRK